MESNNHSSHGGARPGAGRKNKTGGKTVVKRIPESLVPAVDEMIAGLIDRNRESGNLPAQAWRMAPRPTSAVIPLANDKIPAGFPSPAEPHISDYIDFNEYLVATPAATIAVRSGGLSMFDAGIDLNDLLIIDRSVTAKHGDIVMADLGNEYTIKRLHKKAGRIELRSENSSSGEYPNFVPSENDTWSIVGVVRFVIKDVRR